MTNLSPLISRLQQAEGPSRELDAAVWRVVIENANPGDKIDRDMVGRWPLYTAPRDAALLGAVDGDVRLIRWGKTSHVPIYGWCLADQGVEDFDICQPTDWMHLPLPPEPRP